MNPRCPKCGGESQPSGPGHVFRCRACWRHFDAAPAKVIEMPKRADEDAGRAGA